MPTLCVQMHLHGNHAVLVHQSEVRFVDQGSGLQDVVRTFVMRVARRHTVKFVVHGGKKLVQNASVPYPASASVLMQGEVLPNRDNPKHPVPNLSGIA
jgi:hypothetical protein